MAQWYQNSYGQWGQWQPEWQPNYSTQPFNDSQATVNYQENDDATVNYQENHEHLNGNNNGNNSNENGNGEQDYETFYLLSHAGRDPVEYFYTQRSIYHILHNRQRLQTGKYRRGDKVLFPILNALCGDDRYEYDIPFHRIHHPNNVERVPNIVFTRHRDTHDYEGIYKCWGNSPDQMYALPQRAIRLSEIVAFLDQRHAHYELNIIGCRGSSPDPYIRIKSSWETQMVTAKSNGSFEDECLLLGNCETVGGKHRKTRKTRKTLNKFV